jgi:hypothetical protein
MKESNGVIRDLKIIDVRKSPAMQQIYIILEKKAFEQGLHKLIFL